MLTLAVRTGVLDAGTPLVARSLRHATKAAARPSKLSELRAFPTRTQPPRCPRTSSSRPAVQEARRPQGLPGADRRGTGSGAGGPRRDPRAVRRTQPDCFSTRASSCSSVWSVRSGCASSMWLRAFDSNSTSVSPRTLWPQKHAITRSPGCSVGRLLSTGPIILVPRGTGESAAQPWSPRLPPGPRA